MPDLIHGGSRTVCAAAIVLACILGVAIIVLASYLRSPASADLHVGAGFIF